MSSGQKRIVEIRLIVIVLVDITEPSLTEALTAASTKPPSVAQVVASEVSSNLESVPYVKTVVVSPL